MLASPRADLARAAVQQWVLTHPEPKPNLDSPTAKQTMLAAAGSYDYYCTHGVQRVNDRVERQEVPRVPWLPELLH